MALLVARSQMPGYVRNEFGPRNLYCRFSVRLFVCQVVSLSTRCRDTFHATVLLHAR